MRSVFFPRLVNGPFGDPALYVRYAHLGEALLFDLGDLHPLSPRDLLKVRAVFVSHAHIDHFAGFDTLLRTLLYRPAELLLCGPPGFAAALTARAEELARLVAGHAPLTLRATKEALRRLRTTGLSGEDRDLILMCYMSEDFREGMEAFLAKRPPVWRGA